jgi:dTDP-4-amino-4,6-dideoxygalactose transaminase
MDKMPAILGGPRAIQHGLPPWPVVTEEIIQAVVNALRQGKMSETTDTGLNVELEEAFKRYHDCRYALAVNSGTAALDCAVFAAGVGPGDEVITSPLAPGYVVTPILHLNGIPVFADVDPRTGCLAPDEIEKHITKATKAIMVVHLNGHPADMDPIMEIAARHGLKVIEDCAHSQGSVYRGRKAGVLGHVSAFSLQSVKNMPCGEGGVVLTNDLEMYERATVVAHHPARLRQCLTMETYRRYLDTGLGWNYRIHLAAAAIGVVQMKHFDDVMALRRRNAEIINQELEPLRGVSGTYVAPDCVHTYYSQMLSYDAEELDGLPLDAFLRALGAEGVRVRAIESPVHEYGIFQDKEFYGKGCPWKCQFAQTERSYDNIHLPRIEAMRSSAFYIGIGGGFVTENVDVIREVAEAFRKVVNNASKIREAVRTAV